MKVERKEAELIKIEKRGEVEGKGENDDVLKVKTVILSDNDLIMPRVYTQIILVYQSTSSSNQIDTYTFKKSLSKALIKYPSLAGTLINLSGGRLAVEQNNQGVMFIEAEADVHLSDLGDFNPNLMSTDFVKISSTQYLLHVQLTSLLCGSKVVSVCTHHSLADGDATFSFIRYWANLTKSKVFEDEKQQLSNWTVHEDRSLLTATRNEKDDPILKKIEHPEYKIVKIDNSQSTSASASASNPSFVMPKMKQMRLLFNSNSLKQLKEDVSKDLKEGEWVSTNDALTALIWQNVTKARGLKGSEMSKFGMAVNGRNRCEPPLPTNYFGNANFYCFVEMPIDTLINSTLSQVAKKIRDQVNKIDNRFIRSALSYVNSQENVMEIQASFSSFLGKDFAFTSWSKFGMYDIDFGYGRPKFAGIPPFGFDGLAIMMDSPNQGEVVVTLGLVESHMDLFLADPVVSKYVSL